MLALLLWLSSQANATSVRVRLFSAVWITCNLTFVVTKTPFLFDNAAEICVKLYLFLKGYILLRPPTFCFYFLWGGLSFNYGVQTPQTPHNSHPVGWQRSGLGRWHSTRVATKMNTHVVWCRNAAPPPSPPRYWHLKCNYSRNTQIVHFAPSKYNFKCSWGMRFSPELVLSNRPCTSLYQSYGLGFHGVLEVWCQPITEEKMK